MYSVKHYYSLPVELVLLAPQLVTDFVDWMNLMQNSNSFVHHSDTPDLLYARIDQIPVADCCMVRVDR